MIRRNYPILEYDSDRSALIRPENIIKPIDISAHCVLCFFGEAIETFIHYYPYRIAAYFKAESLNLPLYEIEYNGGKVALIQAAVGAPLAAGQIEELTALGCSRFIACGSCGVLQKELAVGHLIVPTAAVRDEGTSYHYAAPSREIFADEQVIESIVKTLEKHKVPWIKGKTWTTDAFYRETPSKIRQRKKEKCVTVEMETSAYIAAARYNGVKFGQILYAGDNLDGEIWDSRDFTNRTEIRELVLRIALDACLEI